eukprot:CAMPEP_0202690418 /NCGR_PEP_ID=MMETSP1385-20130828/5402_1 /ASSEMBLY_ACC=CAM_ASM_000861 /TAXON_ID=933848 /ORGANISM="Elphidium margaritaceum" /LENGTH=428 /DNA_ID=CAMNT_0049345679 /DNA_START=347 /DNA_END=1633 /DNA_ORIENTATION=-
MPEAVPYQRITKYAKHEIMRKGVHICITCSADGKSTRASQVRQPLQPHTNPQNSQNIPPSQSRMQLQRLTLEHKKPAAAAIINDENAPPHSHSHVPALAAMDKDDGDVVVVDNSTSAAMDKSTVRDENHALDLRLQHLCESVDVAFEFFDDLMYHYRRREQHFMANVDDNYMEHTQSAINWRMREILVDWFYDLQMDLRFDHETVHAAIHYVDLYLSQYDIPRMHLQLLGVTAVLIASKTYEIIPQPVSELVFLSNDQYTAQQIVSFERRLLKTVNFTAFQVTPYNFLKPWLKVLNIAEKSKETLLIDLALYAVMLSGKLYLQHRISKLIANIVFLSCVIYLENRGGANLPLLYEMMEQDDTDESVQLHVHEILCRIVTKGANDTETSSLWRRFKNEKHLQRQYGCQLRDLDIDTFSFSQKFASYTQV